MWGTRLAAVGAVLSLCVITYSNLNAKSGATISNSTLGITDNLKNFYKRPATIPFPRHNPYTPEKAALGKMLYFDPRVSAGQNMNCASCHNPSFGWEAPLDRAIGSQNTPLGRHAPTVLNQAWAKEFFWDGRASTLEEQAKGPIQADVEMNMPLDKLVQRIKEIDGYRRWFLKVFPQEGITEDSIVKAIATYERTVVATYSPFDRWIDGDNSAISASAKRGFEIFNGKAKCAACHTGWNFTDNKYHDIGLPSDDLGRGHLEPNNPKAKFAFKTPGLRDLTQRMPFMHDGSISDIDSMLAHYISGGIDRPSRSPLMQPLSLSDREVSDLKEFLLSLTGDKDIVPLPILPN